MNRSAIIEKRTRVQSQSFGQKTLRKPVERTPFTQFESLSSVSTFAAKDRKIPYHGGVMNQKKNKDRLNNVDKFFDQQKKDVVIPEHTLGARYGPSMTELEYNTPTKEDLLRSKQTFEMGGRIRKPRVEKMTDRERKRGQEALMYYDNPHVPNRPRIPTHVRRNLEARS